MTRQETSVILDEWVKDLRGMKYSLSLELSLHK